MRKKQQKYSLSDLSYEEIDIIKKLVSNKLYIEKDVLEEKELYVSKDYTDNLQNIINGCNEALHPDKENH